MILYNVTVNIEKAVEAEWLTWMKSHHIPKVLATGMFTHNKIYKLLLETENEDATYSVQYYAESIGHLEKYLEHHAPALIQEHMDRYRHKHVAFRTVLQEVI